ncbi:condensation domain-containing protein, partial [Streptomyces huiliensis]|uniref:condensation domain-containing protein n=1 Tax=Streptomyces huiliensis TaxID=2876027 RepID=UPI001CC05FB6
VFPEVDGQPVQRVLPVDEAVPALESVRLGADALDARLREDARRTFDLTREIPVRAWLYALGPDEHVLMAVVHHIASDGWSLDP